MRPSPPMPEEAKAGFYPEFERGWRKAELAGRAVMLLVVGATMTWTFYRMAHAPLVPVRDPKLDRSLHFENA